MENYFELEFAKIKDIFVEKINSKLYFLYKKRHLKF